jgi:hypothetical protein
MPLRGQSLLSTMKELIEMFAAKTGDPSTLMELHRMIEDRSSWSGAHEVFQRIRLKALDANRADTALMSQYCFEEACAKTLFNFTDSGAPFDADSPYWIVPNALRTARHLGITTEDIVAIVTA